MGSSAAAPARIHRRESGPVSDECSNLFFAQPVSPCAESDAAHGRLQLHFLLEKEAKRIAQSLHDEAGQLLAVVWLKLDELAGRLPSPHTNSVVELRSMLSQFESGLRRLSHELRPMILDDLGLLPAVEFLRQGVTKRTGLPISIRGSVQGRLAPAVETGLYRIIHEALRMAAQGRARQVHLVFRRDEARVECWIRQEGGADAAAWEGAILAMRRRVEDLSGTLLSRHGAGDITTMVSLPLE